MPGPLDCAASHHEALAKVEVHHPRIVFVEEHFGAGGVRLLTEILHRSPGTLVVLLARRPSPAKIAKLTELGAYTFADPDRINFCARVREIVSVGLAAAAELQRRPSRALLH